MAPYPVEGWGEKESRRSPAIQSGRGMDSKRTKRGPRCVGGADPRRAHRRAEGAAGAGEGGGAGAARARPPLAGEGRRPDRAVAAQGGGRPARGGGGAGGGGEGEGGHEPRAHLRVHHRLLPAHVSPARQRVYVPHQQEEGDGGGVRPSRRPDPAAQGQHHGRVPVRDAPRPSQGGHGGARRVPSVRSVDQAALVLGAQHHVVPRLRVHRHLPGPRPPRPPPSTRWWSTASTRTRGSTTT